MNGALVGCGYVSRFHLQAWQRIRGSHIAAVCDLDEEKAGERAREFGIERAYTDPVRMLEEVRPYFLDIATRPESHLDLIGEAVTRGIHVLCQKPIAGSLAELGEMIRLAEHAGVRLCVNENWRWRAWHREMRRLVANGRIGRPFFLRFTARPQGPLRRGGLCRQPYFAEMPRLIIYETGVHLIDTARAYLGDVRRVWAETRQVSPALAGEDLAVVVLEFAGQALGLLDLNWAGASPDRDQRREGYPFRIEGTEGVIELDPGAVIRITRPDSTTETHSYELPGEPYVDSYRACQSAFIHCLHTGEPFETGAREVYNTMAAVFAAYESAETGGAVCVEADLPF